ncbi:MAG: hypothetical protein IKU83_01735, partial [Lachnospiraceae bacterium]|nr:hypothetical protein [Lachnospiraceae bacterium]
MKDNHDEVFDLFDDDGFDFEEDVVYTDDFDDEEVLVDDEYDDEEYEEEYEDDLEEYDEDEEIDEEDDELFTRKSTKKSVSRKGNGGGSKKGLLIALVAILAIVLIVLAVIGLSKGGDKPGRTEEQTTTAEAEQTTEEQTTAAPPTLAADTKPEVKPLMEQYYAAVKSADLAALGKIVDDTANISLQKMEKRAEYIEDFQNLKCYTLDGKDAGTYMVIVEHDVKYVNINTLAPGMEYYYLKTREDGSLYVCTNFAQEELDFMAAKSATEEVMNTIAAVNERFNVALASDAKLNDFYKLLTGGGEVTTAAPDETTPAETTPAETTPADSTTAADSTTEAATTEAATTGDTAVVTDD